jgi:hypothetical protein
MPMPKKRIIAAPPPEDTADPADEPMVSIEEAKTRIYNKAQLWATCTRRCRRMHRCTGDPVGCFDGWWLALPWEDKMYFRTFIKARVRRGLSAKDAIAEADEELARMRAEAERAAAEAANAGAAAQSDRESAEADAAADHGARPMPRIRML